MKSNKYLIFIFLIFLMACGQRREKPHSARNPQNIELIDPNGSSLSTRFLPPPGYERVFSAEGSFAQYLRNLPLKPVNSEVHYFNGKIKPNKQVYEAVIDLEIGKKDLHQCADAIMRLKAEYLWEKGAYDKIHFNFTNGFRVDYSKWMKGGRILVKGNTVRWTQSAKPSNTYETFWKYMETIFTYAGTISLSQELAQVDRNDLKIGDVFIQSGSPGHAVIVLDLVEHTSTGEKLFLLAQSFMPAQEIQVLKNPQDPGLSPWYALAAHPELITPEWTFRQQDLKRFKE